ncbi:serine hydrolase domain-containing protein [Maribacter chungangensis]|uniref:Serine hydrolase domain-containing protein n=1 Tax=Maribacter chungangensis TaxID=1069117 RepID=A0ABW3B2W6_9FLAO
MKYLKILSVSLVIGIIFSITTAFIKASTTVNETVTVEDLVMDSIRKEKLKIYKERKLALQEALELYFHKAISAGDIVGAGVSIVQGDSIVISDGFGKRSIKENAKVDGETVFRLGSLSKGFGGVLATSLQADGSLSFDDEIVRYLPDFKFGDVNNTQKIKIEHILSHTSGTPYHSFTNLVEAGISVAKIANRFKEVTPISAPGLQYSYQNAMFSLGQEVMRKATGKDVKTLLTNTFFKPLNMSHISMDHSDLLKEENIALPHRRSGKSWQTTPLTDKYYNAVLAGGINASSLDMAKWMRFLLGHNPDVLEPVVMKQAFEPFITLGNNNKYYQRWEGHVKSSYGFGWRIHEYMRTADTTETVWHHGGSVNNYRNEIAIYPDADLGICVLINGNSKLARNVIPDLRAIVEKEFQVKEVVGIAEKG